MKKRLCFLMSLLMCLLSLSGCKTETPKVVYTVYPVGYLLERLAQDRIETVSIQSDEIVQRAQIRSDYKTLLEDADLFLYIGSLEPYMQIYGSEIRSLTSTIDLSVKSSIYEFKRYTRVIVDDVESWVETDYYRSDLFQSVDMNDKDLYLWTDPIAMVSMAREIKEWLQENYIEESAFFEENFDRLESDLIRLDAEYQSLSTKLRQENKTVKFVSMTASFGNWQRTYGIQVYPVILSKYGVLPNSEQLEVIKQRIVDDEVKYIVYEPNMSEDMIELFNQLESELELTRVNLSNLSSINETQKNANMDYLSIMYENLSTLENMASDNIQSEEIIDELEEDNEESEEMTEE